MLGGTKTSENRLGTTTVQPHELMSTVLFKKVPQHLDWPTMFKLINK